MKTTKLLFALLFMTMIGILACKKEMDKENNHSATDCVDSTKIRKNASITPNWAPVCGCNGVTYTNSMDAEVNGVISYTNG